MNWSSQESAPLCRWKTDCLAFFMIQLYTKEEESVSLFPRATSQVACLNPTKGWIGHLATAARVKYPAAWQRCKFDTPLLAAGPLIWIGAPKNGAEKRFRRWALFIICFLYYHNCCRLLNTCPPFNLEKSSRKTKQRRWAFRPAFWLDWVT